MKTAKVVIKKYGNRRLYDTSASHYVNLEDIATLVRNGTDVQVIDAKTGEDLTRTTLTQVIVENAKGEPAGLPLELLKQLVVTSDQVGQEFLTWYLKSAFDAYQRLQHTIQGGLSEVQHAALSPLSVMKKFVGEKTEEDTAPNELEQLRQRLVELESRLKPTAKPSGKKSKRPRKPNG